MRPDRSGSTTGALLLSLIMAACSNPGEKPGRPSPAETWAASGSSAPAAAPTAATATETTDVAAAPTAPPAPASPDPAGPVPAQLPSAPAQAASTPAPGPAGRSAVQVTPATPATPPALIAGLPPGPGREVTQRVCGSCHGIDAVTAQGRTPQGWADVITQMQGMGLSASEDDLTTIHAYLSRNLPPN